jgi:hypothetical protein
VLATFLAVVVNQRFLKGRGVGGLTYGGLGSGNQYPIRMAAALLMTIPTAMVFVVFQRFLTQGANAASRPGERWANPMRGLDTGSLALARLDQRKSARPAKDRVGGAD